MVRWGEETFYCKCRHTHTHTHRLRARGFYLIVKPNKRHLVLEPQVLWIWTCGYDWIYNWDLASRFFALGYFMCVLAVLLLPLRYCCGSIIGVTGNCVVCCCIFGRLFIRTNTDCCVFNWNTICIVACFRLLYPFSCGKTGDWTFCFARESCFEYF